MWIQDLITAFAHIERAKAYCLLEKYDEGLAELNKKSSWALISAFDEGFKQAGQIYAAPAAKAYYWKGMCYKGKGEKATDEAEKKKFHILALKNSLYVLKDYDQERCPFAQPAFTQVMNCKEVVDPMIAPKVVHLPSWLKKKGVDTTIADQLFKDEKYAQAIPLYLKAMHKGGRISDKASEILFKLSYSYIHTDQPLHSLAIAGYLADYHPKADVTPTALLQVGEFLWKKQDKDPSALSDAMTVYDAYLRNCPAHQHAAPISARVAKVYYDLASEIAKDANKMPSGEAKLKANLAARQAFRETIPRYDHLIKNYAQTDFGISAFKLQAWCHTNAREFIKGAKVFL